MHDVTERLLDVLWWPICDALDGPHGLSLAVRSEVAGGLPVYHSSTFHSLRDLEPHFPKP